MGILHRLLRRPPPEVWRTETRLLHALRIARPPTAIQWIATAACDLRCPHCYSHAGRRLPDELSTDEACRLVVDELAALGGPTFVVAGGEPTLRADLPRVLEHAAARGLPWALHTHGAHVERLADVVRAHPPLLVAVSLDGPRAFHDAFRGRRGSFDASLAALRDLRTWGAPEVIAGTTVTRENADLVADLYPTVRASGADGWGLHLFAPEGRGEAHRALVPTPAQLRRVAAFAERVRAEFPVELDNEWGGAGPDDWRYRDTPFLCGAGRLSCVVGPTGEVMPCTTTDLAESAGNVRESPLSRLWAEGFAAFRDGRDPLRGDVHDCWLQARHGTSCRPHAFGIGA